jgi:GntR family transcriptional regulator, vanillate catabolism transcriptional regulator
MAKIELRHAEPLHAQVYERLWDQLISGQLKAGERLKDTECAAQLGVSRTPVREALRKLAHDGALDPQGAGGYRVHVFSAEEIGEVYRCRAALEALVVEEVSSDFDDALGRVLAKNLDQAQVALDEDDFESLQRLNGEFHSVLLQHCRNSHLRRLLDQTRRIVQMARRQVLALTSENSAPIESYRQSLISVLEDHRQIYSVMSKREGQRAALLMRGHLLTTARDMMSLVRCCDGAADAA